MHTIPTRYPGAYLVAILGVFAAFSLAFVLPFTAQATEDETDTTTNVRPSYSSLRLFEKNTVEPVPVTPSSPRQKVPSTNTLRTRALQRDAAPVSESARARTETERAENLTVENQERLEALREKQRTRLAEERARRVEAYLARVFRRLEAALERMANIADRVASRIEKLSERNIDTTAARAFLGAARNAIDEGRAALAEVKVKGAQIGTTDSPAVIYSEVRTVTKEAIDAVRKAHRALVEAIKAVRANVKIETEAADRTETTDETDANTGE